MILAATVCYMLSPFYCKDIELPLHPSVGANPAMCVMAGQTELAKWSEEHPNWRTTRFKCVSALKKEERA